MNRRFALAALLALACDGATKDDDAVAPTDDPPDTDVVDTDVDDTDVDDTDVDGPSWPTVAECAPLPPAASGVCDVRPGTGEHTVLRGVVLTPDAIVDHGTVVLDGEGTIACVGCDCLSDPALGDFTEIRCADGVISPGLINPHEHATFSENWPLAPTNTRYDHRHGWRGAVPTPSNRHGTGRDAHGMMWVELRHLMGGTTTMVGSGWADGLVRNPDEGRDGNEGLFLPYVVNETFPLDDNDERFEPNCGWSYRNDQHGVQQLDSYVAHVAEGIDNYAHEEFRCQSSPFDGGNDITEANTAHIHGVGLRARDYDELARDGTVLVWSPRSNISLYGHTAKVTLLDTLGGTIALGTDWSYTGSIHMVRELACADQLNRDHFGGWFSDAELWAMATANAAEAIEARDHIGALEVGLAGDVAIFDGSVHRNHRAILEAGAADVVLVLRGGVPMFGEADSMVELGEPCDGVNVCGEYRAVCLSREVGVAWEDLEQLVDGAYPAFFCDVPDREPTCTPFRSGQFNGTLTPLDGDGDGIADAVDACPTVFNPIRPIDGGVQPDADGDGVGDDCDPEPLGADIDGDGEPNATDNCPFDPNPAQVDLDADGRGDFCDFCPEVANPASDICPLAPPPPSTIPEVRTSVPRGTRVLVQGVVTGVGSAGYAVQDPTISGGVNAGIYVFAGGAPSVAVGDAVDVVGETSDYFGEAQLVEESVQVTGTGTVTPVPLTVAQATQESYETVLVTLTDGAVTNAAYDCSVDGACADPGLWEIGGRSGVVVYDRFYEDADWAARIGALPVTGVMGWRWSRRRLMPRVGADFGP